MSGNFLSPAAAVRSRRTGGGARAGHPAGHSNSPSGAAKEGVGMSGTLRSLRAAWACSGVLDDIALRAGDPDKGPRENAAGEPSRPRRSRRIPGRPRDPEPRLAKRIGSAAPRRIREGPTPRQGDTARSLRIPSSEDGLRSLSDMFWSRTWRAGDSDYRT